MTIKVGDVVRRMDGFFKGMNVGDTGTVTEIRAGYITHVKLKEYTGNHDANNLEVISVSNWREELLGS